MMNIYLKVILVCCIVILLLYALHFLLDKPLSYIPPENYKSQVITQVRTEAPQYDVNVKIYMTAWTEWKIEKSCYFNFKCDCGLFHKFECPVTEKCKNIMLFGCAKCGQEWCFKILDDGHVKLIDSNSPEVKEVYSKYE